MDTARTHPVRVVVFGRIHHYSNPYDHQSRSWTPSCDSMPTITTSLAMTPHTYDPPSRVHRRFREDAPSGTTLLLDAPRPSIEQQLVDIVETERRRLGVEFHDGLGQRLTSLALLAAILAQKLEQANRPEVADARRLVSQIDETVFEARSLVRGLYPAWIGQKGLEHTLVEMLGRIENVSKRPIRLIVDDSWETVTNRDVAVHVFRVIQEAVNNAVKHSGCATVTVTLDRRRVRIADDGRGMVPSETNGFGLRLMEYRAGLLGGRLEITSSLGAGVVVALLLGGVGRHD